jgi:hypothetical protein
MQREGHSEKDTERKAKSGRGRWMDRDRKTWRKKSTKRMTQRNR